jgi:hypothetical protein
MDDELDAYSSAERKYADATSVVECMSDDRKESAGDEKAKQASRRTRCREKISRIKKLFIMAESV